MTGGPRHCPDCGELTEVKTDPDPFADDGPEICPNCKWTPGLA